jgi:serine protease Do
MPAVSRRLRLGIAAVTAFAAGVVFASGLDLTRFGWAQGSAAAPVALSPAGAVRVPDGTASFADIAERVTPAVVAIRATRVVAEREGRPRSPMEEFLEQFGGPRREPREQSGEGSGFLVTEDGYILTNNHVVQDASIIEVALSDRRRLPARLIGTDPTTDVAVIKIDGDGFPTVPLGDDAEVRIGDWVIAVGNPLGLDFTVTAGIISAKGRGGQDVRLPNNGQYSVSDFLQTDAVINPGNSGGPLLDAAGRVVGVNTAIASRTGFYNGYGFAIPINLARQVMDALIRDGKVKLPVMGVAVQEIDADDAGLNGLDAIAGVKVQSFNPERGSPAAEAGIETGDVILSVAGEPVDRVSTLQRVVRGHRVGEEVDVELVRFGNRRTVKVRLADADELARLAAGEAPRRDVPAAEPTPAEAPATKLGITVEAVDPDDLARLGLRIDGGVRVADVQRNGPAAGKLLPGSDLLTEITYPGDRRPIRSLADLERLVAGLETGDYVGFAGIRLLGNGTQTFTVTLRVGGE